MSVDTAPAAVTPGRPTGPAEPWLWGFILADMSVFAMFFIAYLWDFGSDRPAFVAEASHLVVALGVVNALVLLTSSFLVVRAVQTHRAGGDPRGALAGALLLSACFAVVKIAEYTLEIGDGHTLTSSTFFTYYYALTGLHLMHVAIGTVLLVVWRRSTRPGARRVSIPFVEGAAGYWHMVDLLWILIFSFVFIGSHA